MGTRWKDVPVEQKETFRQLPAESIKDYREKR